MNSNSQKSRILKALMQGEKLSKLEILVNFGCWNSGERISELRQEGWPIKTEMINDKKIGKKYAIYSIPNEELINLKK